MKATRLNNSEVWDKETIRAELVELTEAQVKAQTNYRDMIERPTVIYSLIRQGCRELKV